VPTTKNPCPAGTRVASPPVVVTVRPHDDAGPRSGFVPNAGDGAPAGNDAGASACQPPGGGRRLNLLLSYAGWRPEAWVYQIPPLLGPMGVVAHRATSGADASRVMRSTSIHIAVVDLGLPLDAGGSESTASPDGGLRLLEMLRRLESAPPTVIVKRMRSHRDEAREISAALKAGAFAVVDRPSTPGDLEIMLDVLRRCLCRFYKGRWPGTA